MMMQLQDWVTEHERDGEIWLTDFSTLSNYSSFSLVSVFFVIFFCQTLNLCCFQHLILGCLCKEFNQQSRMYHFTVICYQKSDISHFYDYLIWICSTHHEESSKKRYCSFWVDYIWQIYHLNPVTQWREGNKMHIHDNDAYHVHHMSLMCYHATVSANTEHTRGRWEGY